MHPSFRRRLRNLGFAAYDEYLRSPYWIDVKQRFRADDRDQDCYCCGDWENTQLHHKTYERLGEELLDDLVPLCRRCHALVHVLERRGDLNIDLVGLLDQARATRYADQQRGIQERARADRAASRDLERIVRSWTRRLKAAVQQDDSQAVRALGDELDGIALLIQSR